MSERERCIYCRREVPTDADWEANANLPSGEAEDTEAERLGLSKLCWDEHGESCINTMLESGRPASLADALAERDQLRQQVEKLLSGTDAVFALRAPLAGRAFYLPDTPEVRARLRELDQAADQVRKELAGHG
jgi:hypothetical protein